MRQKQTRNQNLLVLLLVLIMAGVVGYYVLTLPPVSPADQLLIREKVALYLAEEKGTGGWDDGYYFLRIRGRDPSPELLSRLERVRPVLPASEAVTRTEEPGELGVFHRQNGKRGVIYAVDKMRRTGRHQVLVDASFYAHPLGAEGYRCVVKSVGEAWEVRSCELEWIS